MLKKLIATTLIATGLGACSLEEPTAEDLGTTSQGLNTCNPGGLEWKPYLAHLAYDAAEDFGRWEFTTDLEVAPSGDRLRISSAGYAQCASRGRTGCPAMTAGLSAQEGTADTFSNGKIIHSPGQIRGMLMSGFTQQKQNEDYIGYISDPSEVAPYTTIKSPTRTGLPHTLTLTNCAVTLYDGAGYTGASQCLRTGSYRMSDLKVGNDKVSSVKVRSGMKLTLYQNDQFGGTSKVQTTDASSLGTFDNVTSSLVVAANDASVCSAIDTYKVNVSSGNWTDIRAKLVTIGYMRSNDILDVRIDLANQTIDVDPYNVDFVPPSQIGGTTYGVAVKAEAAETWRSTDDPAPSIFPVGAACKKKPYGGTTFVPGLVKSMGSYRYCYVN